MYEQALSYIINCILTALIIIIGYNILFPANNLDHKISSRKKKHNMDTEALGPYELNIDVPDKVYGCTSCEINNTWSREFCEDNKQPCPAPEKKYSNKFLQKYRDDFFGFREKINLGSTSEGPDVVDKINENLLLGDGDLINQEFKDQDIGHVFNYLTDNYNKA
jgi:hypothetical protein